MFSIILLLFILPFGISIYLFTNKINKDIKFSTLELHGIQVHQALFNLMLVVHDAQKCTEKKGSCGSVRLKTTLKNKQLELIPKIDALNKELAQIGILRDWKKTKIKLLAALVEPTTNRQNQAASSLWLLMRDTATYSNLILDPKLDTYYIIDILVIIIPNIQEALNFIQAQMSTNQINYQQKTYYLLETSGKLADGIKMYTYATSIIAANAPELISHMTKKEIEVMDSIRQLRMQLIKIIKAQAPLHFLNKLDSSIETMASIYSRLAQHLEKSLIQRIDEYKLYRLQMLLALFSTLMVSLLILSCARRVRLNQEEVDKAACTNAILSTVADGIITINPWHNIEGFNHSAERIFGYKAHEVIGKNVNMLMPEPFHPKDANYWALLNYEGREPALISPSTEVLGRRKNGVIFAIDLTVGVFGVMGKQMLVASIHDITERKQAETIKNEFISIVSHELRTPITSIRGSLGLVLGTHNVELPPKIWELLHIAYNNCERLMVLINDILDIDKMASGQMYFDIKNAILADITQQAVDANQAYVQKFGVHINLHAIPQDIHINIDTARYIQILSNLLSNAAKFSKANGVIDVFVTQGQDKVRISIKDYGYGIPSSFHNHVFTKFSQENSSASREKGGSGLGLNISKQLVEKMNGTIGFTTELNHGTTFWIEFPLT